MLITPACIPTFPPPPLGAPPGPCWQLDGIFIVYREQHRGATPGTDLRECACHGCSREHSGIRLPLPPLPLSVIPRANFPRPLLLPNTTCVIAPCPHPRPNFQELHSARKIARGAAAMSDAAHLSREPRPRTFVRHTPARACAHDGDGPRRLHERAEHRNSRGAAAHGGRGAGQSGGGRSRL